MRSASPATPPGRRPPASLRSRPVLAVFVALLAGVALSLAGWAVTADDWPESAVPAASRTPTTTAPQPEARATPAPPRTPPPAAPAPTRRPAPARAPVLPEPADAPADAYAATPVAVHGTLALPTIGVSQPLQEGVTLTAIDRGPSHWPGTAMPGRLGNVVVAGHRVTHSRPFHDLDRLQPGDPLVFTMNDGRVWTYLHTGTEIVTPDAMHIVDQRPEHSATLFACHPKGSAARRIVAHFRLAGRAGG
jgi:sortase A